MVTTAPVTIEQAAALLGVSATTIRRRIKAGSLQITEARRPQGVVWLVHLPPGTAPAAATDTVDTATVDTTPSAAPAPAEAMVSLIQATIGTVLGPLVGELAASRQAIGRQADRIAELERENGRLTATLEARRAPESVETAPNPSSIPLWLWGARWWLMAAVAVTLAAAVAALLVWPR